MHIDIELTLIGYPDVEQASGKEFRMLGPGERPLLIIPIAYCKMVGPPHEQNPGTHTYAISGDASHVSEDLRAALFAMGGRVVWPPPGEGPQPSEGVA